MSFAAGTSTSTYLWLFAIVRLGCGQDFFNNSTSGLSIRPFDGPSCSAPPQPSNGRLWLRAYFCKHRTADCEVPEGTKLGLGYQLIYECAPGYNPDRRRTVYCDPPGKWSEIPQCKDSRCPPMGPEYRIGNCSRSFKSVKCEEPVLPYTSVELSCQYGWTAVPRSRPVRPIRTCNEDGKWVPSPVTCVLQCEPDERMPTKLNVSLRDVQCELVHTPSYGASPVKAIDYPWHATLYKEKRSTNGTIKAFICGATILRANFVMTAAHCVYDEITRTTEDAGKIYVMAGNEYRDYDHPPRREEFYVQRTAVKKINLPFHYYGLRGNYGSDIALLELQTSFWWSGVVSNAYWDASSPDAPILQSGAIGRVAGFGRTETLDSSPILQAITAPYVPDSECAAPTDTADNYVLVVKDKFCAGYTNGTAVCDGDSGGGLVFQSKNKSYVMGIVSVSLGVDLSNGERTCAKHAFTVYTKVSEYTDWIRKVISDAEQSKETPSSNSNRTSSSTISAAPISTVMSPILAAQSPNIRSSFCVSPAQQTNGQWILHPRDCTNLDVPINCSVAPGVKLEIGTALVSSCDAGYKASGSTEVYCTRSGSWSNLPECVVSNPLTNRRTPVAQDRPQVKASGFPWQASVYEEKNTPEGIKKHFQCVAIVIKPNILLTAPSCVYDWKTNTTLDPRKLFVMAGNIHPDYDSPLHDSNFVRKSQVAVLYKNCGYTGRPEDSQWSKNALLQLEQSLQSTGNLQQPLPKLEGHSELLRELDDRRNIFIFRTARGSVFCYNNTMNLSWRIYNNVPWLYLKLASPSDGTT